MTAEVVSVMSNADVINSRHGHRLADMRHGLTASPAHVVPWSNHLGAMCSRAVQIIPMHMMTREIIPGRKTEGSTVSSINCDRSSLI